MKNQYTALSSLPLLLPDDQKRWLIDHIPYRIRAVLPGIRMPGKWAVNLAANAKAGDLPFRCMGDSIWEGRLASMRWLILFVGISAKAGTWAPTRPRPYKESQGVFITRIEGGQMGLFPQTSPDAKTLAHIWAGCSKASSHPTNRIDHPKVNEPELVAALEIVIRHLQNTIYSKAGKNLIDYVLTIKKPEQLLAEWES
jgi:hypothetical protein